MTRRERGWWHRRRRSREAGERPIEATPGADEPAPGKAVQSESEVSAEESLFGADDALKAIVASYASRQSAAEEPATDSRSATRPAPPPPKKTCPSSSSTRSFSSQDARG